VFGSGRWFLDCVVAQGSHLVWLRDRDIHVHSRLFVILRIRQLDLDDKLMRCDACRRGVVGDSDCTIGTA